MTLIQKIIQVSWGWQVDIGGARKKYKKIVGKTKIIFCYLALVE